VSTIGLNVFITLSALVVGLAQIIFFYNVIRSVLKGKKAEKNPWKANSLEWQTPKMPPEHGNWGEKLPTVYRWPYDFSVPGADKEYIPQNVPPSEVAGAKVEKTKRKKKKLFFNYYPKNPGNHLKQNLIMIMMEKH
jgi:cytochrome c oxidase subunit 1